MVVVGWNNNNNTKYPFSIQAIFNTENLFTDIFGISSTSQTTTNKHYICTTNRSNIKDFGAKQFKKVHDIDG